MRNQMPRRGSILFVFPAQTWKHPALLRASLMLPVFSHSGAFFLPLPPTSFSSYSPFLTIFGNLGRIAVVLRIPPHFVRSRTKLNGAAWPIFPSPVCFRPALELVLELTRMPHHILRRAISLRHSFWCYSGT